MTATRRHEDSNDVRNRYKAVTSNRPKGKQNAPEGLSSVDLQDFFREVGWKSKIDVLENQLQNEMVASCAAVETHFNPDPK